MELKKICQLLKESFPLHVRRHRQILGLLYPFANLKNAKKYDPIGFVFPEVNVKAGINYRKFYRWAFFDYYNGLMIKGASKASRVFCMVFPNRRPLENILEKADRGDLVFTHHCCGFHRKKGFLPIPLDILQKIKEKQISIYSLHTPFFNNGPWSTSVQLAKMLGIKQEGEFAAVNGKTTGVFGRSPVGNLNELKNLLSRQTGARDINIITNKKSTETGRVAVIAGNGGYEHFITEAGRLGCDTFLTGTAIEEAEIPDSLEANLRFRKLAEQLNINVIGGGHYFTEKPALQNMVCFFDKHDIRSEFVPDAEEESGDI